MTQTIQTDFASVLQSGSYPDTASSDSHDVEPKQAGDKKSRKHTILFVDDEKPVLKALKRSFTDENYRILTAEVAIAIPSVPSAFALAKSAGVLSPSVIMRVIWLFLVSLRCSSAVENLRRRFGSALETAQVTEGGAWRKQTRCQHESPQIQQIWRNQDKGKNI